MSKDICEMRQDQGGICLYTYDACYDKTRYCRILESTRLFLEEHPESLKLDK
jgi:hypothetical protein